MSFKTIIDNATGVVTQDGGQLTLPAPTEQGQVLLANSAGAWTPYTWNPTFKNRIINGDMRVAQRGASAATAHGNFIIDRWRIWTTAFATVSAQQSSIVPSGFNNSIAATVTAAASAGANDYIGLYQAIEGTSIYDMGWGTASARDAVLSFWVRSSVTGTYGVRFFNGLLNWAHLGSYTINAANTWEKKTIVVPATSSGIWHTNNSIGIDLWFDLGSGSNSQRIPGTWAASNATAPTGRAPFTATLNATFYLTGVQLEVGTAATPFEMRPEPLELQLCQRYYSRMSGKAGSSGNQTVFGFGTSQVTGTGWAIVYIKFPTIMRVAPTIGYNALFLTGGAGGAQRAVTSHGGRYSTLDSCLAYFNAASLSVSRGYLLQAQNNTSYIEFNAEL